MSNYSKTTDFEAKDSLPTGDSGKIIRGAEFETEFDAISTAIATKADTAGPTFTGTLTFETISDGTIGVTAFVDEDNMASNSATLVPTQQSVKAYVDSQVTAQDLDFQADTGGALSIDLDSETMTFTGGTGITTAGSGNDVEFAIDSTVATLTGTQTLTNKTLTSPDVNTPDIDGGTIDGTVIGGTTPAAVSATTVSATGNITVSGTVDGRDVATDGSKLDGIEAGATADQTAAEIRTLVEAATDSNVFTDADHTKLDGIEAGATGDQTNAEIRAAVEAATDSNVFTDADHSKLDGIEALADVTDTTNVTAAGALMDSELTNITAVKALDQGVATTDTPTFAGLATSANVTFGDNDKAIFGVGSDLEIYHSGTTSFITENGTGDLRIGGNNLLLRSDDIFVQSEDGTANAARFNSTTGVTLYRAGAAKLATTSTGIDVTGTVVADGLESSGNLSFTAADGMVISAKESLVVNIDNDDNDSNRAFIVQSGATGSTESLIVASEDAGVSLYYDNAVKLATTSSGIDVTGTVTTDGLTVLSADTALSASIGSDAQRVYITPDGTEINYNASGNSAGSHMFQTGNVNRLNIATNGDISFYEDTGTTAKLFWDASAESLGIGTSSPGTALHVLSGTDNNIAADVSEVRFIGADKAITGEQANLVIQTNDDMATNKGGSIGFGGRHTTSSTNSSNFAQISGRKENATSANFAGYLAFGTSDSASDITERMRIDSSGNLLVNGTSATGKLVVDGDANAYTTRFNSSTTTGQAFGTRIRAGTNSSDYALFVENTSASSMFAVRGDGNVGIGTSNPSAPLSVETSGALTSNLNSTNANGGYVRWQNNGVSIGDIGAGAQTFSSGTAGDFGITSRSGDLVLGTGSTERMRIDSSGNVLVGTTDTFPGDGDTNTGISLAASGSAAFSRDGFRVVSVNRNTSDGTLIEFNKNGSEVGSIEAATNTNTDISVGSDDTRLLFFTSGNAIVPRAASNASADATIDLGNSGNRFKDLHLSGRAYINDGIKLDSGDGIYFGQDGTAANKLDDYEEGTWTPVVEGATSAGSGTYSFQAGNYTKVGNLVMAAGRVTFSGHTGTGNMELHGLPFTSTNTGFIEPPCIIHGSDISLTANNTMVATVKRNDTYIEVLQALVGGGSRTVVPMDAAGTLHFTIIYQTA